MSQPATPAPDTPDTRSEAPTETSCRACPLRPLKLFMEPTGDELEIVQSLKRREHRLGAGATLIHEGQTDAPLYTLLHGWAFRYKTLSDGRRQILSFLLAGDFVGVQQKAAHRRWARPVAGAHEQDLAQARAARPAPHCRRPSAPARREGPGPAGRPVR
jgi:CRP-like cAMP-binding protein